MHVPAASFRTFTALLLTTGFLAGTFESHADHAPAEAASLRAETAVSLISHPHQTLHIEAAETASVPPCPACILHLESRSREPRPARAPAALAVSGYLVPPDPFVSWTAARRHTGPSRAPPRV